MNSLTKVFLRADGNSQIGLGHLHRLVALSQILKENFHCVFLTRSLLPGIQDLILQNCHEIVQIGEGPMDKEIDTLKTLSEDLAIFVLDGYHFGTRYQKEIKDLRHALVCIDDLQSYHFVADAVSNPAGGVNEKSYSKEKYTQLYTGPKYAMLKRPFLNISNNKKQSDSAHSILICMGGADPENFTLTTLRACVGHPFQKFYVVIGEAYLHKEQLQKEAHKLSDRVEILINLKAEVLADIMSLCSTAICSASGISYEYLSVSGELYVRKTAQNQKLMYDFLLRSGLAYPFEQFRVGPQKVMNSIALQKQIFDGKAPERLRRIFLKIDFDLHVNFRRAKESDLMTLFAWANDPGLRAQSYNSGTISLEDHSSWFNKKLNDPNCHLYIFEYKSKALGQVRFDIKEEVIISYSVDKEFRGRGWGVHILKKAIDNFAVEYRKPIKVIGYVKVENVASNKIFESLGFVRLQTNEYPNSYKYEYVNDDRSTS